jgi:hypothetical protein
MGTPLTTLAAVGMPQALSERSGGLFRLPQLDQPFVPSRREMNRTRALGREWGNLLDTRDGFLIASSFGR